jgi:hypothetical protein
VGAFIYPDIVCCYRGKKSATNAGLQMNFPVCPNKFWMSKVILLTLLLLNLLFFVFRLKAFRAVHFILVEDGSVEIHSYKIRKSYLSIAKSRVENIR